MKINECLQKSNLERQEAAWLLAQILEQPISFLYAWPEKKLTCAQIEKFNIFMARRQKDEPIAYILGHCAFWSFDLKVTPDVLIPRPETELLVELALERIPKNKSFHIADLGSGSGAVAMAIAQERPQSTVHATDISRAALTIAKENVHTYHLKNILFYESNWFDALPPMVFDMIVSNPPYIAKEDVHLKKLTFEPLLALQSGEKGLDAITHLISHAKNYLKKDGYLLMEHGYDQAHAVRDLFQKSGYYSIELHRDLNQQGRVTSARMDSIFCSGLTPNAVIAA